MKLFLQFFILFFPLRIVAQDSFIKAFEEFGFLLGGTEISLDKNQIYVLHENGGDLIKLSILDKNGNFNLGLNISPNFPEGFSNSRKFLSTKNDNILVSFKNNLFAGLVLIDSKKKTYWATKTSTGPAYRTLGNISSDDYLYSGSNTIDPLFFPHNPLGVVKFKVENGNVEWNYKYYRKNQRKWNLLTLHSINSVEDQPIFTCHTSEPRDSFGSNLGSSIVSISKEGEILNHAHISYDSLHFSLTSFSGDSLGNIYVPANVYSDYFPNRREGIILKFNKELEIVWAKRLSAENFIYEGLELKTFENGDLIFAYYTDGDLPIIAGKINTDGKLLWNKGYSFFNPKIEVGADSSIYFLSNKKYFQDGTWELRSILSKTDSVGSIQDCERFNACLTLYDINVEIERWEWEREDGPQLEPLSFQIDSFQNTLIDHCGNPPLPIPYFEIPDTICINQFLEPDSLTNEFAHGVKWTITGDDLLFESTDNTFRHYFDTPGKYQIEQEIWVLGCSDFYTREVVVLPDTLGDLLGDYRMVCDSTLVLKPNASRPLRSFKWDDGSENSELIISQSGSYAITVSDGFCSATDEVEITFFDEWLSGIDLELPNDTSICQELFPFTLTPKSDFSNDFFLNGSTNPQSNFEIKTAGNYQISTKIEGCEITKYFNLSLIPCEVDIYIPSSFSPNNDGINDVLKPLGKDFIGQQMQVFDRWGGLLFETKNPPFAWNGGKVEEGVYVVTFSYFNLKNQQEEIVSGDVVVVR